MAAATYLSKQNAARSLDVSTKTIDRLRAAGELEWIPVGSRVRIEVASLEAYEARQRRRVRPAESADPCPIPVLDDLRARKAAAAGAEAAGEAA